MADIADRAAVTEALNMRCALAAHRIPDTIADNPECEECGEPICPERRRAVPWAATCIDCQKILERRRSIGGTS